MTTTPEIQVPEDIEKRIAQYVQVRDAKKRLMEQHSAELKPLQELLDTLGGRLQKFMDTNNVQSLKTNGGTCYTSVKHTASVQDPDAFMKFVIEHNQFDLLVRAANSTAVVDYVKEHNSLPAGVNLNAISSVGVRRPTGKKED